VACLPQPPWFESFKPTAGRPRTRHLYATLMLLLLVLLTWVYGAASYKSIRPKEVRDGIVHPCCTFSSYDRTAVSNKVYSHIKLPTKDRTAADSFMRSLSCWGDVGRDKGAESGSLDCPRAFLLRSIPVMFVGKSVVPEISLRTQYSKGTLRIWSTSWALRDVVHGNFVRPDVAKSIRVTLNGELRIVTEGDTDHSDVTRIPRPETTRKVPVGGPSLYADGFAEYRVAWGAADPVLGEFSPTMVETTKTIVQRSVDHYLTIGLPISLVKSCTAYLKSKLVDDR
jgi:hypothetical protein